MLDVATVRELIFVAIAAMRTMNEYHRTLPINGFHNWRAQELDDHWRIAQDHKLR
jgi:hypothetical protein